MEGALVTAYYGVPFGGVTLVSVVSTLWEGWLTEMN